MASPKAFAGNDCELWHWERRSLDAKKKELVGNFTNPGKEYHKKGHAPEVNAYDFLSLAEGKATPYGVYDIQKNNAWTFI